MAEFFRGEEIAKFNRRTSVGPGGKEHFDPYTDLETLARETADAVRAVNESRKTAASWVGSEPKSDPESNSVWNEQATRELMGYSPTVLPTSRYLKSMVEAPRQNGEIVVDLGKQTTKLNGAALSLSE